MAFKLNFEIQCKINGLPEPQKEVRVVPGRKWRWDYAWAEPYCVGLEVQGGAYRRGKHHRPEGYDKDLEKLAEATLAGWLVLWATPQMLADGRALAWAQRALKARGWAGVEGEKK
jgi:hypothetical protein